MFLNPFSFHFIKRHYEINTILCTFFFWTIFIIVQTTSLTSLFTKKNAGYLQFGADDIKTFILSHPDTAAFEAKFQNSFGDFSNYLKSELISDMEHISVSKEETIIADELFRRLSDVPLVDPYEAYQILDQNWTKIAVDLEIIQTEGFAAVKQVDPNMVVKKKDNKEYEVQDGWVGHVLPFDLVQSKLLSAELASLKADEEERKAMELFNSVERLKSKFEAGNH